MRSGRDSDFLAATHAGAASAQAANTVFDPMTEEAEEAYSTANFLLRAILESDS